MKKFLIGLVVFIVLIIAGYFYLNNRNRTLSPPGNAELSVGELTVTIPYSRPSVRGRVIFGTEADGALQPYGNYWRLGANETTQITFSKDVSFAGKPVKAGTYRIYAIPGKDNFEVRLNSEIGFWGASEPDYSKDFLTVNIPVETTMASTEQFTISLISSGNGMNMLIDFAEVRLTIPIQVQ